MTVANSGSGRRVPPQRARRFIVAGLALAACALLTIALTGPRDSTDHGPISDTFNVPSNWWFGLSGQAAQAKGTLAFEGNCPVLRTEDGTNDGVLVLPWGIGVTYQDGTRAVVHRLTGAPYAIEGGELDLGGGWDEPGGQDSWEPACDGAETRANINSWP